MVFYKAGSFQPFAYDFDINSDGTLQTPARCDQEDGQLISARPVTSVG